MKYPAIYKSEDGSTYLHASKLLFSHLVNGKAYEWRNFDGGDEHEKDTNITAEYLANTYGEVKSKEHAEFIVKLAEVNDLGVISSSFNFESGYFAFKRDGSLYFFDGESHALMLGRKQITIPLPHESNVNTPEEDFEMKQIAKNNDAQPSYMTFNVPENAHSFTIINNTELQLSLDYNLSIEDGVHGEIAINAIDSAETPSSKYLKKQQERFDNELDSLKNNGDNLIFGDADKCKEWPCVGSKVTWGNCSHTAEVIAIHNNVAWLFTESGRYIDIAVSKLQKPKTPEQELRDELVEFIDRNDSVWKGENHHNPVPVTVHEFIADAILSKYNITKKGEGDEF